MELVDLIFNLYRDLGKEFLICEEKLRIIPGMHVDGLSGCFTITLELVVIDRIHDTDDYGIVFSTNAQKNSHYATGGQTFKSGLYLMSDLSFGDGGIVTETQEFNYLPFEKSSGTEIFEVIEKFTLSKIELVKEILHNKYQISIEGS